MNPMLPRVMAFFVGFLSLSQEILWTRLVSFSYQTKPQAFALVLTFYLLGIAIGSAAGRAACWRIRNLVIFSGSLLLVAGVIDLVSPWLYALAYGQWYALGILCALITLTAALKSVLFPIVHHLGSNDVSSAKGSSFSKVYSANIIGSALGPLFAGLILLQVASLQDSFVAIAVATLVLGCAVLLWAQMLRSSLLGAALAVAASTLLLLPNTLTPALAMGDGANSRVVMVLENRSGIVHARSGGEDGDVVYGTNVYDGRINTDLRKNSNGIHRAYALATMHPDPRRVLVIGLSGGAWTKVIAMFPTVEKIDVVEINPSYLTLISRYSAVSDILTDRRISYYIDDGRRWLRLHPEKKYDLIVLNSTHHWRANATNLLSMEFMQLVRSRLLENGIFYVNSTDSPEVMNTAASVFDYVYRYENFVAASDRDFKFNMATNRSRYTAMRRGSSALFDMTQPADRNAIQNIYDVPLKDLDEIRAAAGRDLEIITDGNMVTEYRYGVGFP